MKIDAESCTNALFIEFNGVNYTFMATDVDMPATELENVFEEILYENHATLVGL